jgi:predicted Zn-dependent protease
VIHVVKGSAADEAGLAQNDVIVEIKDTAVEPVRERSAGPHERLLDALMEWKKRELPLAVRRGEQSLEVTLVGKDACKYPVALVSSDAVNAFADGRGVGITSGMVRFVESDDELALVIGHELAHNTLGHLNRRQANALAGTILGVLVDIGAAAAGVSTGGTGMRMGGAAGSLVFSKEFESESDYLGTYMAARAGFEIAQAPMFWRRMAVEHPSGIGGGSMLASHPSTPERATALEQTIAEIEGKAARNEPLVPEQLPGERRREG